MPVREETQAQALDWESTSGESLGGGGNDYLPPPAKLGVGHENLAVQTDSLQNPHETEAIQESATLNWLHNQIEDDTRPESLPEQDSRTGEVRYQDPRQPPHPQIPNYQYELEIGDFLPHKSEEESQREKQELREGFVFELVAYVFIFFIYGTNSFDILDCIRIVFIIRLLKPRLKNPLTTISLLYGCMYKRAAPVAVMCFCLICTQDPHISPNYFLACLIMMKVHGIVRRQDLVSSLLKFCGSKGTHILSLWNGFANFCLVLCALKLSVCLSMDTEINTNDRADAEWLLYGVHYSGVVTVIASVYTDGWNLYPGIEPLENQTFWDRVKFANMYSIARYSDVGCEME